MLLPDNTSLCGFDLDHTNTHILDERIECEVSNVKVILIFSYSLHKKGS